MAQAKSKRRKWRLLAVLLLAGLAAPGHFVRSPPQISANPGVTLVPLDEPQPDNWNAGLQLRGIWEITGNDWRLGGWSALVPESDGQLLAFSDRGMRAVLDPAGGFGVASAVQLPSIPADKDYIVDIESAALDADRRTLWLGLEYYNAVVRFDPNGPASFRQPDAMQRWSINSGPEAMARLLDGSFIIFAESGGGLLFPGDPVEGAEPFSFSFEPAGNFQPTDAATLPDGSLLILLRSLERSFPPFDAKIVHADPVGLEPGAQLDFTPLVDLVPALPSDNYEGLAITQAEDGTTDLWLVSDDNQAALQRSLLVHLNWDSALAPAQDAHPAAGAGQ